MPYLLPLTKEGFTEIKNDSEYYLLNNFNLDNHIKPIYDGVINAIMNGEKKYTDTRVNSYVVLDDTKLTQFNIYKLRLEVLFPGINIIYDKKESKDGKIIEYIVTVDWSS
jgi:hypothetical protein